MWLTLFSVVWNQTLVISKVCLYVDITRTNFFDSCHLKLALFSWLLRTWTWSRSVVSDSLRPHGLQSTRLLCPWDFPGNSTGVDCHFLLQGIFPTQGSNPGLLHRRQTLHRLSHQGSPCPLPLGAPSMLLAECPAGPEAFTFKKKKKKLATVESIKYTTSLSFSLWHSCHHLKSLPGSWTLIHFH